ncbi:hypothetical protein [uncultured Roseobacter sp.]|uniref:hypothetical protein n=1 Tax=uncultured Roseobacter sp. TaxID=114847 RepID=UPI0026084973|nr:hypothetical protein [uncultured Roseobacter sp.]
MSKLRSRIAQFVPRKFHPLLKRQVRRFDRLRGHSTAQARPGVILMLHVGRCGSTVLANLLAQNNRVHWDGKLPRKALQLYGDGIREIDYSKWIAEQFTISGDRFYGFEFKILPDQYPAIFGTTTVDFLKACRTMGVTHYILLTRRNTLRHVVSHYASKSRGNWHAGSGEKIQKKEFSLNINDITTGRAPGRALTNYLQEVDAAHAEVRTALTGEKFLELEYERDIDEAGAYHAYTQICTFLGVPTGDVKIRNRRMNPYPLDSVLENYDEVVQTLAGSDFAWMTCDERNAGGSEPDGPRPAG